jgi:serine phosphatase RsbU (regulator of sigma subunit)
VTLLFGILDLSDGTFVHANAAHPPAAIVSPSGEVVNLGPTGTLLGAFEGIEYAEATARLDCGDVLFLYTDGLTETRGAEGFYGEDRVHEVLPQLRNRSVKNVVEDVVADVLAFGDGRLNDDLAILAVKRQPCVQDAAG